MSHRTSSRDPIPTIVTADLAGIVVFSLEGATAAAVVGLDVFGILVVGFCTSLAGGIIRDVLIGDSPPYALRDMRYAASAIAAAAIAVVALRWLVADVSAETLLLLDAAGLSLFAVSGGVKSLHFGIKPFVAAMMGTVSAVGGGVVRDVMLGILPPSVLRADVLALPAFVGAAIAIIGVRRGRSEAVMMVAGGASCLAIRAAAIWFDWSLPKAVG